MNSLNNIIVVWYVIILSDFTACEQSTDAVGRGLDASSYLILGLQGEGVKRNTLMVLLVTTLTLLSLFGIAVCPIGL